MSLDKISKQLNKLTPGNTKKLPPIESWNPPYCGEIDLQVKGNGDWFYGGTIFKRLSLVKLFASVLLREVDGDRDEYFLVTPAEKVKIVVEDAPFVLTQWAWQDDNKSIMTVSTNVDDEFVLDETHPITMNANGELYVLVRRNLLAKVHRNVYYQWIDIAREVNHGDYTELVLQSAGYTLSLGRI
mgnify:CR=1 FL=1|tara:strand:- start:12150 stop:12704 length:555 start_codon:yes stop_codon:yes gene_type:complete